MLNGIYVTTATPPKLLDKAVTPMDLTSTALSAGCSSMSEDAGGTMPGGSSSSCSTTSDFEQKKLQGEGDGYSFLPPPIQGSADWRKYRCLKLDNGVTVCLVNDRESKTTAMAATVSVGAAADPRSLSGLAHFCEHMCFLGSAKYPGENEYKRFIAQHGGRSNGSTSLHLTTYKNEVLASHAEPLLDIFCNFFLGPPLFTESGTGREINAVDSENSKNLVADIRRRLQILKALGDPNHYFTKFTTGNAATLPTATPSQLALVRAALLAFHATHYQPERITVVVAGPQSLDTLQQWTVPRFAQIQRRQYLKATDTADIATDNVSLEAQILVNEAARHLPPYHHSAPVLPYNPPFRPQLQHHLIEQVVQTHHAQQKQQPSQDANDTSHASVLAPLACASAWPVEVTIKPVRSMRKLALLFPLPPVFKNRDRSPTAFLSHLLGHEGPFSPFAVLQNMTLVSSLSAGSRFSGPDFIVFQVEVGLTELGEQQYKAVVDVILQHCHLIATTAQRSMTAKTSQHNQNSYEHTPMPTTLPSTAPSTGTPPLDNRQAYQNDDLAAYQYLQNIWVEMVQLNSIFFQQTSPGPVYDLAPDLCNSIVQHGTEMALSAGHMLMENETTFPLEDVAAFAAQLIPSNMIIERCGDTPWQEIKLRISNTNTTVVTTKQSTASETASYASNKAEILGTYLESNILDNSYPHPTLIEHRTERWYGIEYFLSQIHPQHIARWETHTEPTDRFVDASHLLRLPLPNRYIPRSLEVCPELPEEARLGPRIEKDMDPPILLVNDESIGRLWHRLDDRYALPKSSLHFLLRNSSAEFRQFTDTHTDNMPDPSSPSFLPSNHDPIKSSWNFDIVATVHSSLITSIFKEALAQDTYDAKLSGLNWGLSVGTTGIQIDCNGFSDRLPDLFLNLLNQFLSGQFLQQSYFLSVKDRMIRNLQTYFESQRADAQAQYFRDFVLTSMDNGIDDTLQVLNSTTIESTREHLQLLLKNTDMFIECLYMGNVAPESAVQFFQMASNLVASANKSAASSSVDIPPKTMDSFRPDSVTRRVLPGSEIQLHFQSKNHQEENGACMITFQSNIPGFRGQTLSTSESLHSSACIRLLCHMLREPLFNELRTKQALGYIVSSYHDLRFSFVPSPDLHLHQCIPVDFIVLYVLSKKVTPSEIASRIDEFLLAFRELLVNIPDSEINNHATALSTKLLKPIQKLGTESSTQFGRIRRYASEVIGTTNLNGAENHHNTNLQIPWDSAKVMSRTIQNLKRDDLLQAWDRLVLDPSSRSRIVSCVYGTTFPLQQHQQNQKPIMTSSQHNKTVIFDSLQQTLQLRSQLAFYNNTILTAGGHKTGRRPFSTFSPHRYWLSATSSLSSSRSVMHSFNRSTTLLGIATVVGVGVIAVTGWTMIGRQNSHKRTK